MKLLQSLLPYLKKYKFRLFVGSCFILLQNYMAVYPAVLIKEAFNFVEDKLSTQPLRSDFFLVTDFLSESSISLALVIFSLGILLLASLKGLFTYFMRKTIIVVSRLIEYDMKNVLYNHLQTLDTSFFKENSTGDIMNRLSDDVTKTRMFLGPGLMYGANVLVLFSMILPEMFSINAKLSLFVLMPIPLIAFLVYAVSKRMYVQSDKVQRILSNINSFSQEAFSGIRIVKSYLKEQIIINKLEKISNEYKKASIKRVQIDAFLIPLVMLLIGLSTIIAIYVGGREKIAGHISLGNIAQFVYYINMLTWPVMAIGWISSLSQRAAASMDRINHFLYQESKIQPLNLETNLNPNGDISFKNISFVYPETGIQALKNVSFKLERHKTLGILGKTGSGKTTIINLLTRHYDVTFGEILFNNIPINEHSLFELRKQMAYVSQDIFLFSDTIKNNIAMGSRQKLTDEQIYEAAKKASVYKDIMEFEHQFDSMIGERGVSLSGGQKQRISIARAFVKEAPILIFDDCLSAVDTETEKHIIQTLKKEGEEKTLVIVSHRVSSVTQADHIIVLQEGEVSQSGSHEQLIKEEGFYQNLYKKQMLTEKK